MITVISDPIEVFGNIEHHSSLDVDFTRNAVQLFSENDRLYLLLFVFAGKSKGPRLCTISNPPAPGEIENELLPYLMTLDEDEDARIVRDLAMDTIRDYIEGKNNSRLFFDAH